jgi:hypothetical protein
MDSWLTLWRRSDYVTILPVSETDNEECEDLFPFACERGGKT